MSTGSKVRIYKNCDNDVRDKDQGGKYNDKTLLEDERDKNTRE